MKFRLLKRRSGVEEREALGSSQSRTSFDVSKWNALLNDDPGIAKIVDRLRPLGQKWVDEFAHLYLVANDKQRLPEIVKTILAAARRELELVNVEGNAGAQYPIGTIDRVEPIPPENSHRQIRLQAAEALERVDAHNRKLMGALHYFANLATGTQSRDFAIVKQEIANTQALINSSAHMFLELGELAGQLHDLAEEKGPLPASTSRSDERRTVSAIPQPLQNENDKQKRANMVLSEIDALLKDPLSHKQSTTAYSHQKKRIEEDEQRRVNVVLSEINSLLQEPGTKHSTDKDPAHSTDSTPSLQEVASIQKLRLEQRNLAVVSPRTQRLNAVEGTSAVPSTTSIVHREPSEPEPSEAEPSVPKINDPLSREMEALLGKDSGVFSKI
jgi:hypothetical protein